MYKIFRSKSGMTLIEVLAAIVILSILIVPLAGFFTISRQRAQNNAVQRQALSYAEAYMESLRNDGFGEFLDLGEEEFREWDWEWEHDRFDGKVRTEVSDLNERLLQVTVFVSWEKGEVSLSTLVSRHRWEGGS